MAAAPKTVVIFDCESDGRPYGCNESRGVNDFKFVQCTCVCALIVPVAQLPSLKGAVQLTCWRDGHGGSDVNPFEPLLQAFDAASIIVGYNAFDFDFPLLWKHYGGQLRPRRTRYFQHRTKCLDMFARLRAVSDIWAKLDDLLKANNLPVKTSNGRHAIHLWENSMRDELEAYCQADVLRTADLALLPQMVFGSEVVPEHVYGLMPMVRAVHGGAASEELDGSAQPQKGGAASEELDGFVVV